MRDSCLRITAGSFECASHALSFSEHFSYTLSRLWNDARVYPSRTFSDTGSLYDELQQHFYLRIDRFHNHERIDWLANRMAGAFPSVPEACYFYFYNQFRYYGLGVVP